MKKEVGYCDYYNKEWVRKYNDLEYGNMYTEIVGNTFYIKNRHSIETRKVFKKVTNIDTCICVIPMIKTAEETIRDVLRSWNFGVKYEWLYEELKGE